MLFQNGIIFSVAFTQAPNRATKLPMRDLKVYPKLCPLFLANFTFCPPLYAFGTILFSKSAPDSLQCNLVPRVFSLLRPRLTPTSRTDARENNRGAMFSNKHICAAFRTSGSTQTIVEPAECFTFVICEPRWLNSAVPRDCAVKA